MASGSSIDKAWCIIAHLETQHKWWRFVIVLPSPNAVEIWTREGFPLTPLEKSQVRDLIKVYLESEKA